MFFFDAEKRAIGIKFTQSKRHAGCNDSPCEAKKESSKNEEDLGSKLPSSGIIG